MQHTMRCRSTSAAARCERRLATQPSSLVTFATRANYNISHASTSATLACPSSLYRSPELSGTTSSLASNHASGCLGHYPETHKCNTTDTGASHTTTPNASQAYKNAHSNLSAAARAAWRATLATAASAIMLQGSLALPQFTPLAQDSASPSPDTHPSLLMIASHISQPPAAAAATTDPKGAAKLEQLSRMATPDVKGMKELSEELASRPPPPAATTTAPAATPVEAPGASAGKAAQQGDPNARLKAQDLADLLRIPVSQAKSLMASERDLGRLTRGAAAASFDALRELLLLGGPGDGTSAANARLAEQAGRLVARQPRVLLVAPGEMRERFLELQSLLSAPPPVARRLVAAQPGLLTHTPATLRSRLTALCPVFNVDPALAAELAKHEPGLLAVNAGELAARQADLAAELKLNKPQVVAVVRRHPQALLTPSDAMRARLRSLAALLEVPRGEPLGTVVLNAPRLVVLREEEAARGLGDLGKLLQVDRQRAVAIAAEHPALIATPASVLEERLRTVAELSKMPLGQARRLVEQRPRLLTKSSPAMRRAVAAAEAAEAAEAEAEARKAAEPAGAQRGQPPPQQQTQQQGFWPWDRR